MQRRRCFPRRASGKGRRNPSCSRTSENGRAEAPQARGSVESLTPRYADLAALAASAEDNGERLAEQRLASRNSCVTRGLRTVTPRSSGSWSVWMPTKTAGSTFPVGAAPAAGRRVLRPCAGQLRPGVGPALSTLGVRVGVVSPSNKELCIDWACKLA